MQGGGKKTAIRPSRVYICILTHQSKKRLIISAATGELSSAVSLTKTTNLFFADDRFGFSSAMNFGSKDYGLKFSVKFYAVFQFNRNFSFGFGVIEMRGGF